MFGIDWPCFVLEGGEHVQQIMCFAWGSVRCDRTSPPFTGDTPILSVQHLGEDRLDHRSDARDAGTIDRATR